MKEPLEAPSALFVTEEQFYAEQDEDSPYQYLGGELVCEPASDLHEDVFGFLYTVMRVAFEERGGGAVRGSRYPMRLDPKWSPEPDVMVVRDERRHLIGRQRLEGPADLVIEVASPDDVRRALGLKLPRYRQAAIPEIWMIDPYARSVQVEVLQPQKPEGFQQTLEALAPRQSPTYRSRVVTSGRLDSTAFPWFWIDVSWLWQEPLPPALTCVDQILGS